MLSHKSLEISGGKKKKKYVHIITASCAAEMLDYANEHQTPGETTSRITSPAETRDLKTDFKGVAELCKIGWTTGTNTLVDFADKIREEQKKNQRYSRDTTGLFFDIADVVAGVPECFFRKSEPKKTKEIQINVGITGSYKVNASTLHNRGAAILALIQTLQAENWRVKLSIYSPFLDYEGGNSCIQRIDLDTRPLDPSEVALIIAHPGYMRRIGFAVCERTENENDLGGYGGGSLTRNGLINRLYLSQSAADKIIDAAMPEADNYLNFMDYVTDADEATFRTPESSEKWVEKQLERIK